MPATPEWTVKDIVSHLAGTCSDILAGNIEGVATDPWTAAQVRARRDTGLDEVLEEWATAAPQVEAMASMFPADIGRQWIADVVTHEHDIRGALDEPGARAGTAMDVAIDFMGRHFTGAAAALGLTGLRVRVNGNEWASDEGSEKIVLTADPFEFARAVAGRRSLAQIRQMDWSDDPEPYLKAFEWGPFRPAGADITEP